MPFAPGLFSTTIGCLSCSLMALARIRAALSDALPAGNGTMSRKGLVGKACANAGCDNAAIETIDTRASP